MQNLHKVVDFSDPSSVSTIKTLVLHLGSSLIWSSFAISKHLVFPTQSVSAAALFQSPQNAAEFIFFFFFFKEKLWK